LEALELRRWHRSFTIRLAGVAELADALDSKSICLPWSGGAIATLLPLSSNFHRPSSITLKSAEPETINIKRVVF
jgi:hypothetical protein